MVSENTAQPGRAKIREYVRQIAMAEGLPPGRAFPALPRKLYRVSEIAEHLGITRQTVHNYATIGLITEEDRTPGGQRLFAESVFDRLVLVQRLKPLHRLSEIRRLLAAENRPSANTLRGSPARQAEPSATHSPGGAVVAPERTDATSTDKEAPSSEQPET
jgi:DNA-binding transcriptional MerR regulator